jgi:hypothetical protein
LWASRTGNAKVDKVALRPCLPAEPAPDFRVRNSSLAPPMRSAPDLVGNDRRRLKPRRDNPIVHRSMSAPASWTAAVLCRFRPDGKHVQPAIDMSHQVVSKTHAPPSTSHSPIQFHSVPPRLPLRWGGTPSSLNIAPAVPHLPLSRRLVHRSLGEGGSLT